MPFKRLIKKLVLSTEESKENGYVAAKPGITDLVGKTGIAKSTLRPTGTAIIDGELVDVITLGEFLQAGTKIIVTRVEGVRVIVKEQ
jgi:membrane-bound serine protease (ClpP class)